MHSFSLLACISCVFVAVVVLSPVLAQQQQQPPQLPARSAVHPEWTLDPVLVCKHNGTHPVDVEVFLTLSNRHLLLAGEQQVRDAQLLEPLASDAGADDVERRLSAARRVFAPPAGSFAAVETALFAAEPSLRRRCTRRFDSVACKAVPAAIAESLFGMRLCFYTHKTFGRRLLTDRAPSLHLSAALLEAGIVEFVSGPTPFAEATHFGAQKQPADSVTKDKAKKAAAASRAAASLSDPASNYYQFPGAAGGTDVSPVILDVDFKPSTTVPNQFDVVAVVAAFMCMDGSGPVQWDAVNLVLGCTTAGSAVPTSMTVQVLAMDGTAVATQQLAIPPVPSAGGSSGCGAAQDFSQYNANGLTAVCQFSAPLLTGIPAFQQYQVRFTATNGQTTSAVQSLRPYWAGSFQTSNGQVAPILSLTSRPSDIRLQYGIDSAIRVGATAPCAQGVLEFAQHGSTNPGKGYNASDLAAYMARIGETFDASLVKYVGSADVYTKLPGGEAALDIELIYSLAPGAETVMWAVGVGYETSTYSSFLDAILGMFQTLATDSSADVKALLGTSTVPVSWSISFGSCESGYLQYTSDMGKMSRADNYLMMLQQAGVSVFVSSGDSGASCGNGLRDVHFPSSLVHAVSVGATAFIPSSSSSVSSPLSTSSPAMKEIVCSSQDGNMITSGGGYSAYFTAPAYQTNNGIKPGGSTAKWRAMPDVSSMGANIEAMTHGVPSAMYGTSAAAPIWAAITTLLNYELRLHGGSAASAASSSNASSSSGGNATAGLRKVHYFLYGVFANASLSGAFTDIVTGNNCAGRNKLVYNFPTFSAAAGNCYSAGAGYDLVTGLGTPNFRVLVQALTGYLPPGDTPAPPLPNQGGAVADLSDINAFISKNWKWFAVGFGVLTVTIVATLCYRRVRARRQEALATLYYGGSGQSDTSLGGGGAAYGTVGARSANSPRSARSPRNNNNGYGSTGTGYYNSNGLQ